MAGPIIRQGIVSLGIEYKAPKFSGAPIAAGIAQQQKAAAVAMGESTSAANALAESLRAQARAEEEIEQRQQRSIDTSITITQEKRIAEKQAKALADAVAMEAASVGKGTDAQRRAAAAANAVAAGNIKAAQAYHKAALGSLQMTRGFALLAGAENDSLAAALKHVFVVQGLIDISKGALTVQKALATAYAVQTAAAGGAAASTGRLSAAIATLYAVTGPVGIALGIFAGVLIAGKAIIDHFIPSVSELEEEERKAYDAMMALVSAHEAFNEQARISNDADLERIKLLDSEAEKQKALADILAQRAAADDFAAAAQRTARDPNIAPESKAALLDQSLAGLEKQKSAAEAALDVERAILDAAKEKIDDQIELVKLRDRELQQAKDALKVEDDKARALRAQIGALNRGEQNKLKRLLEAADNGSLTRKQALDLQKLGGQAGQDIAEVFLAKMDKGLGDLAEKLRANITGEDPLAEARAAEAAARTALNKETGGKSADQAVAELQAKSDQVTNEAAEFTERIHGFLRDMVQRISSLETEQSQQRQAARNRSR